MRCFTAPCRQGRSATGVAIEDDAVVEEEGEGEGAVGGSKKQRRGSGGAAAKRGRGQGRAGPPRPSEVVDKHVSEFCKYQVSGGGAEWFMPD